MTQVLRSPRFQSAFWIWLITILELRTLNLEHYNDLPLLAGISRGIAHGTPPWHAFQNRLLVPIVTDILTRATHGHYDKTYNTVCSLVVVAVNILTYRFLRSLGESRAGSIAYTALGAAAFAIVQDKAWLYGWDFVDTLASTILAYGIYRRWGASKLLLAFLLEILNREDALLISIWMVWDSFERAEGSGRLRLTQPGKLAAGLVATIAGMAWVIFTRHVLFKHQMAGYPPETAGAFGNFLSLPSNITGAIKYSFSATPAFDFLSYWIVPAVLYALWRNRARYNREDRRAAAFLVLECLSIPLFASMMETRVYLPLIPIIVFMTRSTMSRGRTGSAPQADAVILCKNSS